MGVVGLYGEFYCVVYEGDSIVGSRVKGVAVGRGILDVKEGARRRVS